MYNRIEKKSFKIIKIPKNTEVSISDNFCYIKGPKGSIKQEINENIEIEKISEELRISIKNKNLRKRYLLKILPLINTTSKILKNLFTGVLNLYTYSLCIKGIGYKAKYETKTKKLQLYIGYSNIPEINIPENMEIEITDSVNITIKGISKQEVGQLASDIKSKKPVEIYKGNGIRYKDEIIKLKLPKKKQK